MDDSITFGRDGNWYRAPPKSGRKTANATWQTVGFLCWYLACLLSPKVPSQAERFPIIAQCPKWGGWDQLWWGNPDSQGYWAHIATSGALNRYKELRWHKPSPYEGRMIAGFQDALFLVFTPGVLFLPQWSWQVYVNEYRMGTGTAAASYLSWFIFSGKNQPHQLGRCLGIPRRGPWAGVGVGDGN